MRSRQPDEYERGDRAKDQEVAAVAQAERVPQVADQAEGECTEHGDRRKQPEHRDLRRLGMQFVFQHVRRLDVDEVKGRRCQVDEQRQRAKIEEGLAEGLRIVPAGIGDVNVGHLGLSNWVNRQASPRRGWHLGSVHGRGKWIKSENKNRRQGRCPTKPDF